MRVPVIFYIVIYIYTPSTEQKFKALFLVVFCDQFSFNFQYIISVILLLCITMCSYASTKAE